MSHPARLPRAAYVGAQRLFLTLATEARQAFFRDPIAVTLVESHFLRDCARAGFALLAYCVMPDHVHLLITTTGTDVDASRLVRTIKQTTAFQFKRAFGRQLWQRSFFDKTLRADEDVKEVIAYIVRNPVRAGLVESPADYPFWGSAIYSRQEILEFVHSEASPPT